MSKIGASIKIMHTSFSEGTKFVYAAEIMTAREYRKRITILESAWMIKKLYRPATYKPSIKTLTLKVTKVQRGMLWEI